MTQKARRAHDGRSAGQQKRPTSGGAPARERELRAQGRETMRKLLDAGREAFDQRGFHAVRVDDVVKAARTSHGTFYLYFANKEDLFKALAMDALRDMEATAGQFPAVPPDDDGRDALRDWVRRFCDTYATHATVISILWSQHEVLGEDLAGAGLQLLFGLSEAMTQGMADASGEPPRHAELTAVACLMMLERVNYLLSIDVKMPRAEMVDRLSAIMFSAFHTGG
jgi:AcrR family transcriptional regulator